MRDDDTSADDPLRGAEAADEARLTLAEERLRVDVRSRVSGVVRARLVTETVEEVARAELAGVAVDVTRVPVGRPVEVAPATRVEGDVTIVPVVEEELVVTTRLVLREEIHIRRRPTRETVEIPVTLRRQSAIVERVDPVEVGAKSDSPQTSEDET